MRTLTGSLTYLALIVTYVVTAIRNGLDKEDRIPKAYWNVLAWGLGIGLAVAGNLNVMSAVPGTHFSNGIGELITGVGIGSGGSGWHELLSRLSGEPAKTPKGLKPRARST